MPTITVTIDQESHDKLKEMQVELKKRWIENKFPYYPDTIEKVARHVLQDGIRQRYYSCFYCIICGGRLDGDGNCHDDHEEHK